MAGPGQGVAAAFGAGQVGDLGVVDEAGCFPDADDAPAFDAGVPSTGGAYPNVMRRTLMLYAPVMSRLPYWARLSESSNSRRFGWWTATSRSILRSTGRVLCRRSGRRLPEPAWR